MEITRFDPGKPDCQGTLCFIMIKKGRRMRRNVGKKQPTVCAPGDFIIPVKVIIRNK